MIFDAIETAFDLFDSDFFAFRNEFHNFILNISEPLYYQLSLYTYH